MIKSIIRLHNILLLFSVVFVSSANCLANNVTNIRMSHTDRTSRLVFDLEAVTQHRVFTLKNPDRVVVDLLNTGLGVKLPKVSKSRVLKGIRSGIQDNNNLRIVLDAKRAIKPKTFLLQPNKGLGHRLVVDLQALKSQAISSTKSGKSSSDKPLRDVIVAIDAGHGGKDPGAKGHSGSYEKHVVLQIARKLADKINKHQGMRAVLIRDGDYFISLRERLKKARENKADLFLSIHADAFHDKSASGSSVYALSLNGATSEAAQWLAQSSNVTAELKGGINLHEKDDVVASVLLNLSQTATIQSSLEVGQHILNDMGGVNRLHRSKVQQAGFVVLKSPDIPSVLIETAFLSNPREEKNLRSKDHQLKIASAITRGVVKYFKRHAPPGTLLAQKNTYSADERLSQLVD